MKELINIGIADDHSLLRQGLVALLKAYKNIHLAFEVSNGKELLDELKVTRPDIILLDLEMPIITGREVLEKINKRYPKIQVIVLSGFFEKDYIVECFKLGVKAFLPKGDPIETVVKAIFEVHQNGIYSDSRVAKILANEIQHSSIKKQNQKIAFSTAELKVLRLICKGTSRREAAEVLEVKTETVNFHMKNIMLKTGIHKTSELVNYIKEKKLISSR